MGVLNICCNGTKSLGCFCHCGDTVTTGLTATSTGVYIFEIYDANGAVREVSITFVNTAAIEIDSNNFNEAGLTKFKVKNPAGAYMALGTGEDCFTLSIRYCPDSTGGATGVTCLDAVYENTDQTYQVLIASGATAVGPDITVTDSDTSTFSWPANKDVTCTPCTAIESLTCAELNAALTPTQREQIREVEFTKSGQTTSYETGDEGDIEPGKGTSKLLLDCDAGTVARFTSGTLGTVGIHTDLSTGKQWIDQPIFIGIRNVAQVFVALSEFNAGLITTDAANCNYTLNDTGFSDWRIANIIELTDISDMQQVINGRASLDYVPWSGAPVFASNLQIWTSQVYGFNTSNWVYLHTQFGIMFSKGRTSTATMLFVRDKTT